MLGVWELSGLCSHGPACVAAGHYALPRTETRRLVLGHWCSAVAWSGQGVQAHAREPEGLGSLVDQDRPRKEEVLVDLEGLLTSSQSDRLTALVQQVEAQTGYRVRVLTQKFSREILQDYWQTDVGTVIVFADRGFLTRGSSPSLLRFDTATDVRTLAMPERYWNRLRRTYGRPEYVQAVGPGQALFGAVSNVCACFLRRQCQDGVPIPEAEMSSV